MRILLAFLICSNFVLNSFGQNELKNEYQKFILDFIDEIDLNDKEAIAERMVFPFRRFYPIPDIKNKTEFIERFDELFDLTFKNEILASKPESDWSEVGWRGIMLNRGSLWMNTEGKIYAINNQTDAEQKIFLEYCNIDKLKLHPSLLAFKKPLVIIETAKFRIRIDELENGDYRYASWAISKEMKELPDLVILKGKVEFSGTGGNHSYTFNNGLYTYICSIYVIGSSETPDSDLLVQKKGKDILYQRGKIIRN
jgi:hypothetical protein